MADLTIQRMRDLLVGAFEGGSNYWYMIDGYIYPEGATKKDFDEGGRFQPNGDYFSAYILAPTTKNGALIVSAVSDYARFCIEKQLSTWTRLDRVYDHGGPIVLNLQALRWGAEIMKEKWPRHWKNVVNEDDDAETADVFLQCALFGNIIFG